MRRARIALLALAATLTLAACGDDTPEAADEGTAGTTPGASVSPSTSPSAVETGLTGDPLCDEVTADELVSFGAGFGVQQGATGCEATDGSQTITWELRPGALQPADAGVPRGLEEQADLEGTPGWEAREVTPDAGRAWVVAPTEGQTLVVTASVPMAESGDDAKALQLARFVATQVLS